MEQMKTDGLTTVEFDYDHADVPSEVKELKPVIWNDGDSYCCVFGPDVSIGIYGCGDTPIDALLNWDEHLRERIKAGDSNDKVAQFAIDSLKASKIV